MNQFTGLLAAGMVAVAACATHADAGPTGTTEDALTDFAGQAGIVEATPEAAAIRAVTNDPRLSRSDYVNTIGLVGATADAIVAHRPFSTLADLDGLPQASAVMFVKLQTYARAHAVQGIIKGSDRSISLPDNMNDTEVDQWGRGLWEGWISLDLALVGSEAGSRDTARIVDAFGESIPLTTTSARFERLPLPVRLLAHTDGSVPTLVSVKNVSFEVVKTNPIPGQNLSGKYTGTGATNMTTFGQDIPGVQVTFTATAQFFSNFTNGNGCDTITIVGGGSSTTLTGRTSQSIPIQAIAPVAITAQSTCISARLPQGENADADYALTLSTIILGNPQ